MKIELVRQPSTDRYGIDRHEVVYVCYIIGTGEKYKRIALYSSYFKYGCVIVKSKLFLYSFVASGNR